MQRVSIGLFLLIGAGIAGCSGTARHILQTPEGGVIALPANTELNRRKAEEMMTARFPEGYVIEREEEHVVGQITTTHDDARKLTEELDGAKKKTAGSLDTTLTTRTTSTSNQTEYRITYRRR
ncbi:MAG: hypothetical protein L0Y72_06440 [Gemmataceae bacterium]|nr:hypothetical protein [Gemmataceae bacterium]MCI0738664.1 hypothetical protein [Gemmataceae bacterium]